MENEEVEAEEEGEDEENEHQNACYLGCGYVRVRRKPHILNEGLTKC